jgi:hypothetical protein
LFSGASWRTFATIPEGPVSRKYENSQLGKMVPDGGYVAAAILAIALSLVPIAQAEKYQVFYNFTGGADGQTPL